MNEEKNLKKFELVTHDGAFCESVKTTNFKKARQHFTKNWEGNFIIIDMSEEGEGEKKITKL